MIHFLPAVALVAAIDSAQAPADSTLRSESEYIVSTIEGEKTQVGVDVTVTDNMSAEEKFLAENFCYLSPDRWPLGTRFMVIPGSNNQYMTTFYDRETDGEVKVASLRHCILEYKGHGESHRGRTQIYFYSQKTGREYYYELHNHTFEEFCEMSNTGVPFLAYLNDVDTAIKLLEGRKMYTKTDEYYVDDPSSSTGATKVKVAKNLPITIVRVGVGTREFPVKIVFADERGNRYFQNVCMSRTNSGLRQNQLLTDKRKNAFENSFLFNPMTADEADRAKDRPDATTVLKQVAVRRNPTNGDNIANSWVNIAGGVITVDMTPDDVILAKGQPNRRKGNNRNGSWYYRDGTVVTFRNGLVTNVTRR